MLSYETLDNVFKTTKNSDYYAMPSQANQQTIKDVIEAWDSYFELNSKYKEDASSLNGKPKIPKYADKKRS